MVIVGHTDSHTFYVNLIPFTGILMVYVVPRFCFFAVSWTFGAVMVTMFPGFSP